MKKPTAVICIHPDAHHLILDGKLVRADFNSPGAARAAISVERARRAPASRSRQRLRNNSPC
jgi:hypothetical protein